jgi:hypothetical protein
MSWNSKWFETISSDLPMLKQSFNSVFLLNILYLWPTFTRVSRKTAKGEPGAIQVNNVTSPAFWRILMFDLMRNSVAGGSELT